LIKQIQDFRKVRFLGTAALSISYVACGRADAYYENDIMIWDIAGAIPVVAAAGGTFEMIPTGQENKYRVLISNGKLDYKI